MKALDRIVRGVLVINFLLFILSFIPAWSGIGQRQPGFSDRLWGAHLLYGWSADFLWVCASTLFIAVASIPFVAIGGVIAIKDRSYHKTAIFCLVWLGCFLFYLGYNLLNTF